MKNKKPSIVEINKAKNLILSHLADTNNKNEDHASQKTILDLLLKKFGMDRDIGLVILEELITNDFIDKHHRMMPSNSQPDDFYVYYFKVKGKLFQRINKFPETRTAFFKIWIAKPDHWLAIIGLLIGALTLVYSYKSYINQNSTSPQPPSSTQPLQEVSPSDPASISPPLIDADSSEQQRPISPADSLHPSDTIVSQMPAEYP